MRTVWWGTLLLVLASARATAALEVSPSFLGMYRKTMEVEHALVAYSKRHRVNPQTARAVLMQESGGNGHLVSPAGARGYFQIMPSTFRGLGVRTNIEAGIKYLGQLQRRFGREDYAVAAYNAGPQAVARRRPLALETLQYVIGVGQYRSVLRLHEVEVARQAATLELVRVHAGDSWATLAERGGVPEGALRLYNPFLATRPLAAGVSIVRPRTAPPTLLEGEGDAVYYVARIGDSYLSLAHVFGVDPETIRSDNDLWRLQQLEPGVRLRVRLPADSPFRSLLRRDAAPVRPVPAAPEPRVASAPAPKASVASRTHRVRRGETLGAIARRYRTSARRLMDANGLDTPRVREGARLRIPNA